ncbi:MAG: hypothetical protein ACP6IS_06750 [Candidatus Asgardarchaeia archaeon]
MQQYTIYLGIVDQESVEALHYALIKERVDYALVFVEQESFDNVFSRVEQLMKRFPEIELKKITKQGIWGILTEMLEDLISWLNNLKSVIPPYSRFDLLFDITGGGKLTSLALQLIASLFEERVTVIYYIKKDAKKRGYRRLTLPQLKPIELPPQKFIILYTLNKCGKPIKTLSELGKTIVRIGNYPEYEKISVSNLSRHVSELERLGFLYSIRRKEKVMEITEKGRIYLKYYELKRKLEAIF